MSELIQKLENDQRRARRNVLLVRVLDGLLQTVQARGKTPETPIDDVRVELTMASGEYLAPLIDAVMILEEIIFASDGCVGHRLCGHSMEPWQRARDLLSGKWDAENTYGEREWPPVPSASGHGEPSAPAVPEETDHG